MMAKKKMPGKKKPAAKGKMPFPMMMAMKGMAKKKKPAKKKK